MRIPFPSRGKKVAGSVTDSFDQPAPAAKPPPIGGKFLGRQTSRAVASESSTSRTTSALASLTRFHSRPASHSTASNGSTRERINDDSELSNNSSNLPAIGSSELPRLAPNVCPSTSNMSTGNIVASQATSTPAISYPARVSSSGRTSPRSDLTRKRPPKGLVGLQNLGNTCPTKGALANAFGDLIKALWTGDKFTATRPVELKRVIGKVASRFTGYDQQDAQEFLRFLLDGLHEDLNRVKKKPAYYEIKDRPDAKDRDVSDEYWKFYLDRNASALSELFCGQLRSEIHCGTCSHRSLCFDVFWDLSLPVPKKPGKSSASSHLRITSSFFSGGRTASASSDSSSSSSSPSSGGMSIHDCLKAYTEQEFLSDDAAYYCAKCKTHRSVSKRISVYRLPNVLVLHLKRFSFSTFSRDKVSTSISFPAQSLDLAEYCANDAVVDGSTLYDLTGIVHHMGSLNGGHYTAECLNADTQEWFDFNDSSVTAIKKPELYSSSACASSLSALDKRGFPYRLNAEYSVSTVAVRLTKPECAISFSNSLSTTLTSSTPIPDSTSEMSRTTLSLAVAAAAVAVVSARPAYVALLPNGGKVPGVEALGHVNPSGGGPNNDFGLDFVSAGKSWTKEFCEKDSDGDGQTNGQELGDPCCEWVENSNAVVKWSTGVSHPGNATSKSDPSLWTNIACGSSSGSNSNSTATISSSSTGSSTGTVEAGSTTSSTTGGTTPATDAASSASAASSSSSSASAVTPAMYSAVGLIAAVATFFV
ncbi:unnamed protein product [Phytophthora fragariaefolia]|uniref:ubiquitinyl hydrolase 1 n=1 Tax=Phytophthora fragariaefolia TaxID=1490495 RepID=A0A9W6XMD8_9STRA|nr:unnamed protein product [Phytophthora fragariaefolia]